ncbi:MAG TPA: co-chaperone GroES [Planctomycetes bacterium]|nr:co-chaperone GroES [Planctomycetota bacterium]HIL52721.1 co-chaperone GroES [Planctomycetota bacterium]
MGIRPLGDRILVQRIEAEAKTAGGILLPESAKEKPKEGTIISLGDGRLLDNGDRAEWNVKAGDRVLFTSYGGTEVKYNGEEYLIMEERDILGVIEG